MCQSGKAAGTARFRSYILIHPSQTAKPMALLLLMQSFASRSFAPGDTIGLYIRLPPLSKPSPRDAKDPRHVRRKWIPIRYRGQVYFEQLDYHQTREMERLLEKSWAGDKILDPDGGLRLRRVKGPTGRMGNEQGEWVEVEEGADEDGEEDGIDGPTRASGSGAKMKKQKAVKKASSTPTPAPGGSAASKRSTSSTKAGGKGGGGAAAAEEDKKKKRTLRPLPTLGSTSRIGFFLNGEPLGWAFQDLLDFRPLRQAGDVPSTAPPSTVTSAAAPKKGSAAAKKQAAGAGITSSHLDPASLVSLSTLGLEAPSGTHDKAGIESSTAVADALPNGSSSSNGLDFLSAPLLTTSASLSAIMKSRENPYDDGCCGYFPMVSLYGGARARLISRAEEMKFIPEGGFADVERRLEEAERRRRRTEACAGGDKDQSEKASSASPSPLVEEHQQQLEAADWWGQTRPLADLYPEYWQEQRVLDLEEEERAKARAKWIKTLVEEDEEEEDEEIVPTGGGGGGGGGGAQDEARGTSNATSASKKKGGATPGGGGGGGGGKGARRSYTPRDLTHTPTATPTPPGVTPTLTPAPEGEEEEMRATGEVEEVAVPLKTEEKEQEVGQEEQEEAPPVESATSPAHAHQAAANAQQQQQQEDVLPASADYDAASPTSPSAESGLQKKEEEEEEEQEEEEQEEH
ncbi:hypothetical protein BCV69DRAFT_67579 [Microstroma glucosiphilum]|uniref:Uncharacterized protein n=1 Tax=Pseudomicrostroma glucosiphilum TaxID=1684307 RepID=A0A316U2F0_9BASI|nr:hypothetical protein BCV69DRAFT_67579 [Pseudomicrostroma glucosiphilum]PWN18593.1 hypothetical protein BCV69DRAFT_67579 [Pseudomicrostroma glucosiphilum]